MKFYVYEHVPCWVTFKQLVEAASEQEAIQAVRDGDYDYLDCQVGDAIDYLPERPLDVEVSPPDADGTPALEPEAGDTRTDETEKTRLEQLIDRLDAADKLQEAASLLDPAWEDDYVEAAVRSGIPNYSILDFAADVIRDDATDTNEAQLEKLLTDAADERRGKD